MVQLHKCTCQQIRTCQSLVKIRVTTSRFPGGMCAPARQTSPSTDERVGGASASLLEFMSVVVLEDISTQPSPLRTVCTEASLGGSCPYMLLHRYWDASAEPPLSMVIIRAPSTCMRVALASGQCQGTLRHQQQVVSCLLTQCFAVAAWHGCFVSLRLSESSL